MEPCFHTIPLTEGTRITGHHIVWDVQGKQMRWRREEEGKIVGGRIVVGGRLEKPVRKPVEACQFLSIYLVVMMVRPFPPLTLLM